MLDAWLRAQQMTETLSGFTAREIETMPLDEYARLTGREFGVIEPAAPPAEPSQPGQDPAGVMAAQHPEHATEDPGVDFRNLTMRQYERVREQLGIGRSASARGILG
jgi:hypothetical protein